MKSIQEIVNESGYPLQLLLEELIESDTQRRKWRVVAKEHRWVDNISKEEGYIDLLLEKDGLNIRVVVECKRILGNWIFLIPQKLNENVQITKFLSVDYDTYNYLWSPLRISPESQESSFCIMETDGKKDSRTLEKYSNELLLSLESIAIEETELVKKRDEKARIPQKKMFYLPIIVTTAILQTMKFNPANIEIGNGQIIESELSPIEYIRFRKNLGSSIGFEIPSHYSILESNLLHDRSVFIVQSVSFMKFLNLINEW